MDYNNRQYHRPGYFNRIFLFLLFTFACTAFAHGQQQAENHSTIIMRIPTMNETQYKGVLDGIAKDNQFTFEYACKESNIIVVKYYHRHHERADVRVAAISSFRKWTQASKLEVIYVDFLKGLSSKC